MVRGVVISIDTASFTHLLLFSASIFHSSLISCILSGLPNAMGGYDETPAIMARLIRVRRVPLS